MTCWYSEICEEISDSCQKKCLRFLETKFLLESSGIPSELRKKHKLIIDDLDREVFMELAQIRKNIEEFVSSGKNLYLFSGITGNGKTTIAVKLMQVYFSSICLGNRFTVRGLFINVPKFMNDIRQNINNPNDRFKVLLNNIPKVDIIIWDDVAVNNTKDYDIMVLLGLVDDRIVNGKSNIYTSNCDGDRLLYILGDRLHSRIFNLSKVLQLKGRDRR